MYTEEYDDSPLQFVKEIRIYLNGDSSKYLDFRIVQNTLWVDIQQALDAKFSKFKSPRLFTAQGVEIFPDDILYLKDGYVLYASRGEDFDPYSPFSQYETIKKLGEGGFGRVTLGRHRITGDLVAIKIIKIVGNAQDIEYCFREAELLRSLTHKNIVKVFNSYPIKNNTQIAVIMEYLEGGELAARLKQRGGKFTEEEAHVYFKQIVTAISYCHSKNIVHRDLKLENLLFSSNDELKVIDFGIAGFQSLANTDSMNIGSLLFMAPEVLASRVTRVSTCVDIWALGVILYKMLFGIYPFDAKTQQELINAIVYKEIKYPQNQLSQEVISLMEMMLEKNHEIRFKIGDVEFSEWVSTDKRTPQPKKVQMQLLTPRETSRKLKPSVSPRRSSPNLPSYQKQQQQVQISKFFK